MGKFLVIVTVEVYTLNFGGASASVHTETYDIPVVLTGKSQADAKQWGITLVHRLFANQNIVIGVLKADVFTA